MSARKKNNPWAERFAQLLEGQTLVARLKKGTDTILGRERPEQLPVATACDQLDEQLRRVRVTSEQEIDIIRELLGLCHGHALSHYGSLENFIESIYARDIRLSQDPPTRMLTSEPGLGKSVLTETLKQVLGQPLEIQVSAQLPPQRFVGVVRVCIEGITRIADLLNALAEQAGVPAVHQSGSKREIESLRRKLYQAGVMLIVVDELQFLTSSATASATIARTLHSLRQLGIPLVFVGNFSLGHKLLRRPAQERQRFLLKPLILLPEGPSDASFIELLTESVRVLDGALSITLKDDAPMIHWYTGGNRRAWRTLLVIAYGKARKATRRGANPLVTMAQLAEAYSSTEFYAFRIEVEAYRSQLSAGEKVRDDLWCPFELPQELASRQALQATQLRELEIRNAALVDSMTPEERAGLEVVLSELAPRAPGIAVPKKPARPRKAKPGLEELQASCTRTLKRA